MILRHAFALLFSLSICQGIAVDTRSPKATDLLSNVTTESREPSYNLIRFEGQDQDTVQNNVVSFAEDNQIHRPVKFRNDDRPSYTTVQNFVNPSTAGSSVSFQDDSESDKREQNFNQTGHKKRRRKRKHRAYTTTHANQIPFPTRPSFPRTTPPWNTKMSGPLAAISAALDSVVQHDTARCVSRMLCEQAAAGGPLANSSISQSIAGLFQYLPFLQKIGGVNTFPLFSSMSMLAIAVRRGAMAKNSIHGEEVCAKQYADCPSDPEERIHYLNTHNGGLFRFFGGSNSLQYTKEGFHEHLMSLGLHSEPTGLYGLQQANPSLGQYGVYQTFPTGSYGSPYAYPLAQENYGLQQAYSSAGQYGVQQPNFRPNYNGLPQNQPPVMSKYGYYRPDIEYANQYQGYSNYGPEYPHYRRFNYKGSRSKDERKENEDSINEIQKRIQNKPEIFVDNLDNNDSSNKWSFPTVETLVKSVDNIRINRGERHLKFPNIDNQHDQVTANRQAKGFLFPGAQSNREHFEIFSDYTTNEGIIANNDIIHDGDNNINDGDEERIEFIYIVRGNGDPNFPEIVKTKSGQIVH